MEKGLMQQQKEDELIAYLKEVIQMVSALPVSQEELDYAEAQLGFELPHFLRRLYSEISNGGLAGMYPLNTTGLFRWSSDSETLVGAYLERRAYSQASMNKLRAGSERPTPWPTGVLIIYNWGCNIYSCLDCSSPDLPVLRMDNNRNVMVEWAVEAPSLLQWLESWIEGNVCFHLDWENVPKVAVDSQTQICYN
jgi:hypothetical protein